VQETIELPMEGREARILALDLGKKRIGLAVSDELGITAQGLPTLERTRIREDLAAISRVIEEKGVRMILLGYPLRLSGKEGAQTEWVKEFGARLASHTGLPVEYWDERWTSVMANQVLRSSGIGIGKRAKAVDRLAAVILLESYLERIVP
jgi:putative Holliday junction resolvase